MIMNINPSTTEWIQNFGRKFGCTFVDGNWLISIFIENCSMKYDLKGTLIGVDNGVVPNKG